MADKMQDTYKAVELLPNERKAFRDQEVASFWGCDLDGRAGLLRGSLKRAVPLAGLLLEVVQIGVATPELLQVLTGSVISLFLFRSRSLALLDPVFQSYRGRREGQVFVLSAEARETLLIVSVLLPMSVSNLRAQVNSRLFASDASNWGEAGV